MKTTSNGELFVYICGRDCYIALALFVRLCHESKACTLTFRMCQFVCVNSRYNFRLIHVIGHIIINAYIELTCSY